MVRSGNDETLAQMQSLAQMIVQRRRGDRSVDFPLITVDEGYRLQDAVHEIQLRTQGWKPKGYKIGGTNAPVRKALGLDTPFFGRLYENLSYASPATSSVNEALSSKIEVEVALKFGHDLTGDNGPHDADSVRKACIAMLPAIEITGSTFPVTTPPCPGQLIADFAGHAFWIFGEAIENFDTVDPLKITASASINGTVLETGTGAAVDGGAFAMTALLANTLNKRGLSIRAGDYVSTGTIVKPVPCKAGQTIKADFGTFGSVILTI